MIQATSARKASSDNDSRRVADVSETEAQAEVEVAAMAQRNALLEADLADALRDLTLRIEARRRPSRPSLLVYCSMFSLFFLLQKG
jgi:hypothetical protein